MATSEEIEKVRQEIMRFRELLTLMRGHLENGERAYTKLFADFLPADAAALKEKDQQWKIAETIIDNLSPLDRAVSRVSFDAHMLEQNFRELHDIIASTPLPMPIPETPE